MSDPRDATQLRPGVFRYHQGEEVWHPDHGWCVFGFYDGSPGEAVLLLPDGSTGRVATDQLDTSTG